MMNKDTVYKAFFETVNESLNWADVCKENEYYNFIDGVSTMAKTFLKKFEEKVEPCKGE